MRELNLDELDFVAGGQDLVGGLGSLVGGSSGAGSLGLGGGSLVGGPGSLVDITTTGAAVDGILGAVGSLLTGLMTTSSSTGKGLLGSLLG